MSSADLLEDGFPHGTPAGYQLGCRGSHCGGIEEFGWSCTYAVQQYRGDFQWRRWVEAGKSPAEIKVLRSGPIVESTPKNVDLVTVPTVRMADSREPIRVAPKPRPVPNPAVSVRPVVEEVVVDGRWRVSRKSPGVWRAVGGGRARGRLFGAQVEAFVWALEQATPKPAPVVRERKPVRVARAYVRMTPEQLARAVELRKAGETWAAIAKQVDVKYATVAAAVTKVLKQEKAA